MVDQRPRQRAGSVAGKRKTAYPDLSALQLCDFTRQLATLVGAGIPLLQSLDTIYKGVATQALGPVVRDLRMQIAAGKSLQAGLQATGVFDSLYCQMVAAGELAGNLDDMLNRLASHTERRHQLHRKVRMALVYPCAVLLIALLVVVVILVWVVPVFQSIFASFGAQLPAPTRFILGLSAGLMRWGLPALILSAVCLSGLRWHYLRQAQWQWQWARWQLQLPLVSALVRCSNLAAWTRCLSMLTRAGVPLLDALEVLAGVCQNLVYAQVSLRIQQAVLRGSSLAAALAEQAGFANLTTGLFPALLVQMTDIGEQSGTLTLLLSKAADAQDEALEQQVQGMTQLIEPLLVVVLGGLVGGMVVALYLPVFQLGQVL
jgi:type IV pilus assembly protein PilC